MPLYTHFGLAYLYNWALSLGVSAPFLISSATVALLWSLLAAIAIFWSLLCARQSRWSVGTSLLLLAIGCCMLTILLDSMSYYDGYGLLPFPNLSDWAVYIGISAGLLIISATVVFLWNLLSSGKKWWLSCMSLLFFAVGCVSLLVALSTISNSPATGGFPDLYNWALYTEISAGSLSAFATIVLLWRLLGARRRRWLAGMSALVLGAGFWSLLVALNGFQQSDTFMHRLFGHAGHGPTPNIIDFILGTAYGEDIQRCQIQFGLTVALFVLMAIVSLWQLVSHVRQRDSGNQGRVTEGANLL